MSYGSSTSNGNAGRFLQVQTAAAYSNGRPSSQQMGRIDSASSSGSNSSTTTPVQGIAPCVRCQRSFSISGDNSGSARSSFDDGLSVSSGPMVKFGYNLYYCGRCASIVGFKS